MSVRPVHDRIAVQRLDVDEEQIGGIFIPETAKEKPLQGKVVAVGSGKVNDKGKFVPVELKVGTRVLFGRFAGQEVTVDDEQYLIMREDEVLAVIEDETPAAKGKTTKKK